MGEKAYTEALKAGKREYRSCITRGRFPYLPVLDEILSHEQIQTEQKMGLVQVPLEFVVGTSTMGRTRAFAANFMPLLETSTEFSYKWANLADAQVTEGIRDPIIAFEYMNRYYVVEGNKRVSVLKYYHADSIPAIVTRKIPKYSEAEEVKLYYEYMKFNEITGVNSVEFTKLGNAQKLLEAMGKTEKWDEQTLEDFNRILFYFTKAYKFRGGDKLPITVGDALLAFLNVYEYDKVCAMGAGDFNTNIIKAWKEIQVMAEKQSVGLVMDPKNVQEKKTILDHILPTTTKKYTVAFLYTRSPEISDWVYAHDLGRIYLEERFPENIHTICVEDVTKDNVEEILEDVIDKGASVVFEVGPQLMQPSLKIAVDHPEVTILNCSLNAPHKYIRTYYARMYEAKFISGMIAGALAENGKIGYIADYPIFGMIANINAFALGAACTNPRAKIYLGWSTKKDFDKNKFLQEHEIEYVSDQDMITPNDASRQFGLYRYQNGEATNLVMPVWNWGIFYERILKSIFTGSFKNEGEEKGNSQALNYWWGMSAGVVELICSNYIPKSVLRLTDHIKKDISTGDLVPFYGEIYSQDGTLRNQVNESMKPEDIMTMDWLVDNVIGTIPVSWELVEGAKPVVELKGVEENK